MTKSDAARTLEDLAREVDLIVFRLELGARSEGEQPASGDRGGERLRRELEGVKERLTDLSRALDV